MSNKYGPRYHKPALGVRYENHPNYGGEWFFRGGKKSDPKTYTVTMTAKGFTCDCPGFKFRGKCKHVEGIGRTVDLIVS
jgi:hypothetical protein